MKEDSRKEAWLRRLQCYWHSRIPRVITRVGEIYEIDFGENPQGEFSGRHLAICLSDTKPSQEEMLVIPLTTKYQAYNIATSDIIETEATSGGLIKAGAVLHKACWISKIRIFEKSIILGEHFTDKPVPIVKGIYKPSASQLRRWRSL